ncbi:MAG: TonB-dependent receptor [Janthinobacterium lividum]
MKSRYSTRILSCALVALSAVPGVAVAQTVTPTQSTPSKAQRTQNEEAVEVRGTRSVRTHLQSRSVSATTVDKKQIQLNQITNLPEALRLEPSVQFQSSNVRNTTINIRGLGAASTGTDGLESGVAIYIDGIYQSRPGSSVLNIPELESITVLKGPQATLGGMDNTSGAIQIETRLPSFKQRAELETQVGDYGEYQIKADYSNNILGSDKAAFSLDYFQSAVNGYITNVDTRQTYNGDLSRGIRGQLLLRPDDAGNLQIRVIGGYNHDTNSGGVSLYNGTVTHYANGKAISNNFLDRARRLHYNFPSPNAYALNSDINSEQFIRSEDANLSVHADYNLNTYTLSSISAGSLWNFYPRQDADATGLDQLSANGAQNYQHQFTQEFRLTSPASPVFDYSAGLFYLWEEVDDHSRKTFGSDYAAYNASPTATAQAIATTNAALNGVSVTSREKPTTNSYSVYANGTWHIVPRLDLTSGLRYTYETKNGSFLQVLSGGQDLSQLPTSMRAQALAQRNAQLATNPYQALKHDNGLISASMTLTYHITGDQLGYATYSRGQKSGGVLLIGLAPNVPATVDSEYLDDYEMGYKSSFLHGRLIFNADAFWMVDHNYQTSLVVYNSAGTALTYLANAKSATTRGFETDVRAIPMRGLSVFSSLSYDDAYYSSFNSAPCAIENSNNASCNFTGSRLALVPKWSGVLGFEYEHPISHLNGSNLIGYGGATTTLQSSNFSATNDSIYSRINGYGLLNLTLGIRPENRRWDFSGWVHNATDKKYFTLLAGSSPLTAQVGNPLMFGFTFGVKL